MEAIDRSLVDGQQFLEEGAVALLLVDQVHLQDPVPLLALGIQAAQRLVVLRMDVKRDAVAVDLLMRELADRMAGMAVAEIPAAARGDLGRLAIELRAGDV